MEKNIKDYLHLYLGCECETDAGKRGTFAGFDFCEKDFSIVMHTVRYFDADDYDVLNDDELCDRIKLVLRPLSSMTEEEITQWKSISNANQFPTLKHMAEEVKWMLSKGFDLYDLIPAGLAIDKTKVKDTQR